MMFGGRNTASFFFPHKAKDFISSMTVKCNMILG